MCQTELTRSSCDQIKPLYLTVLKNKGTANKKTARRRSSEVKGWGSLSGVQGHLVLASILHKANASKAQDHHGPGGGLGDSARNADHARLWPRRTGIDDPLPI